MASWTFSALAYRDTTTTCMQRKCALYLVTTLLSLCMLEGVFYGISLCIPTQWYYKPPTREAFLHYLAGDIDWEVGWRPEPDELSAAGYRLAPAGRSEERRVGKECTSWCRSRWSPYH